MCEGGVYVVVGGLLTAGALVLSSPYWWPVGQEYFNRRSAPALPSTPEEDRAFLEKRVKEYWQARAQNDSSQSFQYEHPIQQKQVGEPIYQRRIGATIGIKEFTVLDCQLQPDGEAADVRLAVQYRYSFRLPGAKPLIVSKEFIDYWQKEQGVWYHVLDFKLIPDGSGRPMVTKKTAPEG